MLRTSIQGQPTVKIAPHQQVGSTIVNTNPINITATRPIQTTLSGTPTVHITGLGRNGPTGSSGSPFYVHVLQGASNVAGDAAQYAMQAAIQAMIWGLLGKLGIGAGMAALVKMLKDITKGGGGKPGPGSPITDPALLLESAEMKEERKDKALRDALNAPGNRQPANSSTFILTGVQNYVNAFGKALATADWGAGLRAAGAGLAITAAIGGAILGGFKAMSTTPAVITGMSKAIGDAMVKAIANWDNPKNQGVLNQHKKGGPPVPGRWVGANYETTDSLAGNPPAPYAGYTEKYQQGHWWYDKKAGTPWHGGGTGFGTATQVPSSITDQLAAIIQTPKSSTLGGVHALRHTPTTVTNHNTINIYDANNPDKVRAVVVQALTEFSEGVRSQRRRAG